MQFGICGGPELAGRAEKAGFDYFEWSVGGFLKPREDEECFNRALEDVRRIGLPCPAVNVFLPADLKVTGPVVDPAALKAYVATACRRAQAAGVRVIVLGSGGARRIPDGFDRDQAWDQLLAFSHVLAPLAMTHGVTVAVEPLNVAECNVLNTVSECARLVRQVNHPAFRLLVDAYHLLRDGDSLEDIVANRDLLVHIHVATLPNRLAPGMEACDQLSAFFKTLARSGYDGRISIEGSLPDTVAGLASSLSLMKSWFVA